MRSMGGPCESVEAVRRTGVLEGMNIPELIICRSRPIKIWAVYFVMCSICREQAHQPDYNVPD